MGGPVFAIFPGSRDLAGLAVFGVRLGGVFPDSGGHFSGSCRQAGGGGRIWPFWGGRSGRAGGHFSGSAAGVGGGGGSGRSGGQIWAGWRGGWGALFGVSAGAGRASWPFSRLPGQTGGYFLTRIDGSAGGSFRGGARVKESSSNWGSWDRFSLMKQCTLARERQGGSFRGGRCQAAGGSGVGGPGRQGRAGRRRPGGAGRQAGGTGWRAGRAGRCRAGRSGRLADRLTGRSGQGGRCGVGRQEGSRGPRDRRRCRVCSLRVRSGRARGCTNEGTASRMYPELHRLVRRSCSINFCCDMLLDVLGCIRVADA